MTDEELMAVRERIAGMSATNHRDARRHLDLINLLAEIDRLRAKTRHADEGELARIRAEVAHYDDTVSAEHLSVIDLGDSRKLLAHIDATDGLLNDMQSDAGAMLAYEQGAAEERTRIVHWLRSAAQWATTTSAEETTATWLARKLEIDSEAMPDLLPPATARVALDAEKRKVGVLRAAMERVNELAGFASSQPEIHKVSEKALEESR